MLSLKVTSKLKGQMSLLRHAMDGGASHRNNICCHTFQNFINANFNTFFLLLLLLQILPRISLLLLLLLLQLSIGLSCWNKNSYEYLQRILTKDYEFMKRLWRQNGPSIWPCGKWQCWFLSAETHI